VKQVVRPTIERVARLARVRVEPAYHGLDQHRLRVLRAKGVELVLDVGANVGQYAQSLRRDGYSGRIVSFEPQPEAAGVLESRSLDDPLWSVEPYALGAEASELPIYRTSDSVSSSLLAPRNDALGHGFLAGEWRGATEVRRLDDVILPVEADSTVYLKLDVQGYELNVLAGATATLAGVAAVECELTVQPLYEGQVLIEEIVGHLRALGFTPTCLTRGYTDPVSHEVVQMDGIFVR
jgi:FkbM family methyltransferase